MTIEAYEHGQMRDIRQRAIEKAAEGNHFGIILGTLGRQGRPRIVQRLESILKEKNKEVTVLLLSEIFPNKLKMFPQIDAFIQVACPRLSIDWGYAFEKPLLSPYEAEVCLQKTEWKEVYPMDYYSKNGGSWTNYFKD